MTTAIMATVIRYEYDPANLADIPRTEFEAELYDALKARWPGSLIDIVSGGVRAWGVLKGGDEIPAADIQRIGDAVFARCCERSAVDA